MERDDWRERHAAYAAAYTAELDRDPPRPLRESDGPHVRTWSGYVQDCACTACERRAREDTEHLTRLKSRALARAGLKELVTDDVVWA